jgi:DNA-binding NtrC family response regulator
MVVGSGKRCGRFLESLAGVPGVRLAGFVDPYQDAVSPQIAGELDAVFSTSLELLAQEPDIDLIIDTTEEDSIQDGIQRNKPEGALVLRSATARLVRILAASARKGERMADRFRAARREMDQYAPLEERMIGKSDPILLVQELITKVAPTPTTVLFLGETGTGKDLAARLLQQQSRLRNRPFITVNCTALAAQLMESELFGYKKGAFTGAEQDRKGLLEEADGGTVFLDEIGDMHLELQAKLLRFLQTGEIRSVGSTRPKNVHVRVIAATNRDLDRAVTRGEFRQDLYYRFNAFTITLPPLRERLVDLPYLAYHFVTKAEIKVNKKVEGIKDEAMSLLCGYAWPGNVRELENVIERAVILCKGEITPAELPIQIQRPTADERGAEPSLAESAGWAITPSEDFKDNRDKVMAMFEKKELQQYIRRADGNISEASRQSGIPRRTFYRLMKKHGL